MKAYLLIAMLMHVNFISASAGSAATASASASSSSAPSAGSAAASRVSAQPGVYDSGFSHREMLLSGDGKRLVLSGDKRFPDSAQEVQVYSIDQTTGKLILMARLSLQGGIAGKKQLSFDGSIIAWSYGSTVAVYWVNSDKFLYFGVSAFPWIGSIILSQDGRWLLIFGLDKPLYDPHITTTPKKEGVLVYRINAKENKINFVGNFLLRNSVPMDSRWQLSSNARLLFGENSNRVVAGLTGKYNDSNDIFTYDFNNNTGEIKPITGDMLSSLRSEKEHEEAQKVLSKLPVSWNDPKVNPIPNILRDYIIGPDDDQPAQKESSAQAMETCAVETPEMRLERMNKDAAGLFQAIAQGDLEAVKKHLTEQTISARYGNELRTPLLEAILLKQDAIVLYLLSAVVEKKYGEHHTEKITVNVTDVDSNGNNALMMAILTKNYGLALTIAEKMSDAQLKMHNKEGQSAFDLVHKEQKLAAENAAYGALLNYLRLRIMNQEGAESQEQDKGAKAGSKRKRPGK